MMTNAPAIADVHVEEEEISSININLNETHQSEVLIEVNKMK